MVYEFMVYECDNCEAALGPGLTVCPRCGQVFDEPVPADALWKEPAPIAVAEETAAPPDLALSPRPPVRRKPRQWSPLATALLLLGLVWLGYRQWNAPAAPISSAPVPLLQTDLAAHPQYAAHMTALVAHLRAMGVGAEWPAFGSNDVLLITPQARAAEPPVAWDADTYRRLAQGIYGEFAQTRFESGFCDTDTTACFVLVTSASGQVAAVDFMGELR